MAEDVTITKFNLTEIGLHVDYSYQRPLDVARGRRIGDNWQRALANLIKVVFRGPGHERPDERYYTVDGQHTYYGAKWAGIEIVGVEIIDGVTTVAREAELFLLHNGKGVGDKRSNKVKTSSISAFHALVTAKDEYFTTAARIMANYGYEIHNPSVPHRFKPIFAVSFLQPGYRTSPENLYEIFKSLNNCKNDAPPSGKLMTALVYAANHEVYEDVRFVKKLSTYPISVLNQSMNTCAGNASIDLCRSLLEYLSGRARDQNRFYLPEDRKERELKSRSPRFT